MVGGNTPSRVEKAATLYSDRADFELLYGSHERPAGILTLSLITQNQSSPNNYNRTIAVSFSNSFTS